ncbi:MAG: hypothetical protein ACM34N_03305 [Ignavibacteria bacterium]
MIYKIRRYYLSFALIPFLILNSCNNSTEPEIIFFETPVINGIILTAWDSPDEIGRWRNPQYPPGIYYGFKKNNKINKTSEEILPPDEMNMDNPFPNPTTDAVIIRFCLPVSAEVSIWLVKGRLPEENPSPIETGSGGVFVSQKNRTSVVVVEKEKLSVGFYEIFFSGKIGEVYISTGFYRIYVKADRHIFWRDILVARSKADLPPELRDKYFNVGKER